MSFMRWRIDASQKLPRREWHTAVWTLQRPVLGTGRGLAERVALVHAPPTLSASNPAPDLCKLTGPSACPAWFESRSSHITHYVAGNAKQFIHSAARQLSGCRKKLG